MSRKRVFTLPVGSRISDGASVVVYYIIRTEAGYDVYRHGRLVADCSDLAAALAVVGDAPYERGCAAAWTMQP